MRAAFGIPLLAGLLALPTSPAAFGQIPPRPEQLVYPPLNWTPPSAKDHRFVLRSGPAVYLAEDHDLPLVNIAVTLKGGTYLDPPGKEGLADLTGYLLTRSGTKNRTPEALEERLAFLAAQLSSGIDDDRGGVTLNLLSKDLDEGLGILREVLTEPRFAEERLKLRKQQLLADMKQRNDDSADIEARERSVLAFGERFYVNRWETQASVDSISRDDLIAFHRRFVHPRNMLIAVSGDVKRDEILGKLDTLFSGWPFPGEPAPPLPKPDHTMTPGTFLVDKDVNQGRVSILLPGLMRSDPDFLAAQVMNDILGGGGFTSRITKRVRSDEGLAYQAGSALSGGVFYPGVLRALFQSKVRTAAWAARIVLEEMRKMRDGGVTDDELATTKAHFVDTFPHRFANKTRVVEALLDEEFTGRYLTDPDYFARLSPASVATLRLQGGPMSAEEAARFETERFYGEAIAVRRCDDRGKVSGLKTPALADFGAMIEALAGSR